MRVLYCTGGGIGNVVMSTPAIGALGEMGCEVDVMVGHDSPPGTEDLLRGWPITRAVQRALPGNVTDYEACIHSVWHRKRLSGYRERERFAPWSPSLLLREHEAEVNMTPVQYFGWHGGPTPPAHVEAGRSPLDLEPGTYLALGTGCKLDPFWDRKRWGWWEDLEGILSRTAVWLGVREESRRWMSRAGSIDLCGRTTVAEAAGVIAGALCYVGIDNGLAHIAAALGVPTVVLFGATSEVKNRPLGPRVKVLTLDLPCRPCQMTPRWDECKHEWLCMGFDAEAVAEAVRQLLHHG